MDVPERYVRLCLRVARHVEGFVDAYVGPSQWEREAAAEEPFAPTLLRDEAQLLLDGLGDADLAEDRRRWLRGQLEALECVTAILAGENVGWVDEVERCFGVRPTRTDTTVIQDVHRRLDAALPGNGALRDRYARWDESNAVPREKLVLALERLNDVLGPRAHGLAPLPAEESVTYELVSGKPWMAYNWYEGGYRSCVEINGDLPISIVLLVELAAHEAYPGHHTERAAKDAHLHRDLGRVETSVAVIQAPEALVSEGIATNALEVALGPEPYAVVADVLASLDLHFDPAEAHEIHRADVASGAVATNAAFMLHADGAAAAEVGDYLREWGLGSEDRVAQALSFLTDPASRAYVSTYTDGRRLCREFLEREDGSFCRLLIEQLTVADLLT